MKGRKLLGFRLVLPVVAIIAFSRCSARADNPIVRQEAQTALVLDLSTSRRPFELAKLRDITDSIVTQLPAAERFIILTAHAKGVTDDAKIWESTLPRSESAIGSLADARATIVSAIDPFFGNPPVQGTDLVATLLTLAERLRERPESKARVIILSDMLQAATGVNFETGNVLSATDYLKANPDFVRDTRLDGACIIVVGADASTQRGTLVRTFWVDLFSELGAGLRPSNYRYEVHDVSTLECPAQSVKP